MFMFKFIEIHKDHVVKDLTIFFIMAFYKVSQIFIISCHFGMVWNPLFWTIC
jgi:hypothetical protein